MNLMISLTLIF